MTVLLMNPDVELYVLTAGGLLEPKADWTEVARRNVTAALAEELRRRNALLVPYKAPTGDQDKEYAHNQLLKLHEAVGGAILRHKYVSELELPNKKDKFDWALGSGVNMLREEYQADYSLFVYIRDSYTSTGRAFMIFGAALFGVGLPGGIQVGFVSLVDLRSGNILWFNRLISETGDLRTPDPAVKVVKELLNTIPL